MPFLKEIKFNWGKKAGSGYPFNIPSLQGLPSIKLSRNVTFFIGENGSGKSTLMEAVAAKCGFGIKSGSRSNLLESPVDDLSLSSIITLSWMPKVNSGFFLRSETFLDFASYIDELAVEDPIRAYAPYGGKSLHTQSHGESFLSLFLNRFKYRGIYILDEPEAALSPQRQLAFLRILWQLDKSGKAQFLISTHSPILMAYPDAEIFSLDEAPMRKVEYETTEHYQVTKSFFENRQKMLKVLLND